MLHETSDNLENLIREEKHRVAVEFFNEAWKSAVEEGIEPSILAESALVTALTQLFSDEGEQSVETLVGSLPDRLESGHFDPARSIQ